MAVKTAPGFHMWAIEAWPGEMSAGAKEPWPVRLMEVAQVGDELWWHCSADLTWEHLCGQAGWALVRDGWVVDITTPVIN